MAIHIEHGVAGTPAPRPRFDVDLNVVIDGDTLEITTLDRLGRSTQTMLAFVSESRTRGAGLGALNLGRGALLRCSNTHWDELGEATQACLDVILPVQP